MVAGGGPWGGGLLGWGWDGVRGKWWGFFIILSFYFILILN